LKFWAFLLGESPNKVIQCSAFFNMLGVFQKEAVTAFFVLHTIATMATADISFCEALLTSLKAFDLCVELRLIIAVGLVQCPSDIHEQGALDQIQSSSHIRIQLVIGRVLDGLLHQVLQEGGHLCDVTATDSIEQMVNAGLQSCVNLEGQKRRCVV